MVGAYLQIMSWKEQLKRRVRRHIERAVADSDKLGSDRSADLFNSLSLNCMLATNYLESLAELAVEERGYVPNNYIELADCLVKAGIADEGFASDLKRLIHLRNLYAHENYAINDEQLREMIQLLKKAEVMLDRF